MHEHSLRDIYGRTNGHCHFCGDPIKFENRGWSEEPDGHWEVDHVIQRGKGGTRGPDNCLPACTRCNGLRWHRTGDDLRDLLLYGLIAVRAIKARSPIGKELERLKEARLAANARRRQRQR
jgi:hypothetical protein